MRPATNNQVRGAAKLAKKESRSETGLFLLEGSQGLKEALDRPKLVVEIFCTPEAAEKYSDLIERAESSRIPVYEVAAAQLKSIADTNTPQGIVTVCHQLHVELADVLAANPKLIALLTQIRDPGNAGTVLRAADAAGADAVIFTKNSVDAYNPKVVRSTTGSLFHLPMVLDVEIDDAIRLIRAAGLQVFGASAEGVAIPELRTEQLAAPTVWMFGNEAWGFEPGVLEQADQTVAVPIYGGAESLNLATAASICLYASAFAQNA